MFDPKKLQQFSLAANLMPNKGFQKAGAMVDRVSQIQQMKEAKQVNDARKGAAQTYTDNLNKQVPIPTMTKIDDMLNGIYPGGVDPDIQQFYVDLMGKYGR